MKAFRWWQYLDRFNNPNVGYVERDTQQDPKTAKLNKKPFSLWLNTEDTVRSERTTQEIENQIYLAEKMTRESKRHREDTIRLMKELISLTEISNTVMNDVRFTMIANNCKRLLDTFDV